MTYQFDPILGQGRDGAVSLAEQQAGFNRASAAEKAAFQSSVSGYSGYIGPHLLAPSGAFTGVAGGFTLGTALLSIPGAQVPGGGNCTMYFPAGAGGLSAGWRAVTFTSTTAGVIVGSPVTTQTAWTGAAGIIALPPIAVPAAAMGAYGELRVFAVGSSNSSAGLKSFRAGIGSAGGGNATGMLVSQSSTVTGVRLEPVLVNRGFTNQVSGTLAGIPGGGTGVQFAVNTANAFDVTPSLQCAMPTDWAMFECFTVTCAPRN